MRSWHPKDHVGAAHVVTELYVKDTSLCLPVVATLADDDQAKLDARVELLHDRVLAALHDSTGEVRIQRWLPGARQNDEGELSPTASAQELLRETRDACAFTAPVTADEDVEADARGHQRVSLQAQLGFTRPTHPPPGLAAADGGFETAAAPYSRLSSIESDGGSARRSSFSSEQGCVLPTRLRRRSSSGKNVELQDRA